jgi:hypothetical protein
MAEYGKNKWQDTDGRKEGTSMDEHVNEKRSRNDRKGGRDWPQRHEGKSDDEK